MTCAVYLRRPSTDTDTEGETVITYPQVISIEVNTDQRELVLVRDPVAYPHSRIKTFDLIDVATFQVIL